MIILSIFLTISAILILLYTTGVIKLPYVYENTTTAIPTTTTVIPTTTTVIPTTTTVIPTTTTVIPATTTIKPTTTTVIPTTTTVISTTTVTTIYNINSPVSLLQNSNSIQTNPVLFYNFQKTGTVKKILLYCNAYSTYGASDVRISIYNSSGIFLSYLNAFVYISAGSRIYRTGYDSSGIYYVNAPLSNKTLINYYTLDPISVTSGQKLGVYLSNNTSNTCAFNISGVIEYQ